MLLISTHSFKGLIPVNKNKTWMKLCWMLQRKKFACRCNLQNIASQYNMSSYSHIIFFYTWWCYIYAKKNYYLPTLNSAIREHSPLNLTHHHSQYHSHDKNRPSYWHKTDSKGKKYAFERGWPKNFILPDPLPVDYFSWLSWQLQFNSLGIAINARDLPSPANLNLVCVTFDHPKTTESQWLQKLLHWETYTILHLSSKFTIKTDATQKFG